MYLNPLPTSNITMADVADTLSMPKTNIDLSVLVEAALLQGGDGSCNLSSFSGWTLPTLSITAPIVDRAYLVNTEELYIPITFELNKPMGSEVIINYNTADGTADTGSANPDYIASIGTVTFNPGELIKVIYVQLLPGSEMDEYFTLYVSNHIRCTSVSSIDCHMLGTLPPEAYWGPSGTVSNLIPLNSTVWLGDAFTQTYTDKETRVWRDNEVQYRDVVKTRPATGTKALDSYGSWNGAWSPWTPTLTDQYTDTDVYQTAYQWRTHYYRGVAQTTLDYKYNHRTVKGTKVITTYGTYTGYNGVWSPATTTYYTDVKKTQEQYRTRLVYTKGIHTSTQTDKKYQYNIYGTKPITTYGAYTSYNDVWSPNSNLTYTDASVKQSCYRTRPIYTKGVYTSTQTDYAYQTVMGTKPIITYGSWNGVWSDWTPSAALTYTDATVKQSRYQYRDYFIKGVLRAAKDYEYVYQTVSGTKTITTYGAYSAWGTVWSPAAANYYTTQTITQSVTRTRAVYTKGVYSSTQTETKTQSVKGTKPSVTYGAYGAYGGWTPSTSGYYTDQTFTQTCYRTRPVYINGVYSSTQTDSKTQSVKGTKAIYTYGAYGAYGGWTPGTSGYYTDQTFTQTATRSRSRYYKGVFNTTLYDSKTQSARGTKPITTYGAYGAWGSYAYVTGGIHWGDVSYTQIRYAYRSVYTKGVYSSTQSKSSTRSLNGNTEAWSTSTNTEYWGSGAIDTGHSEWWKTKITTTTYYHGSVHSTSVRYTH